MASRVMRTWIISTSSAKSGRKSVTRGAAETRCSDVGSRRAESGAVLRPLEGREPGFDRGAARRGGRAPGAERRWEDDDLLSDRRSAAGGRGTDPRRRQGHHADADARAGPDGDRISVPGAVDLPEADGTGEHPGHPGNAADEQGG